MYNRYIPQPDGSFRRSRMEERTVSHAPPPPPPCPEEPRPQPPPSAPISRGKPQHRRPHSPPKPEGTSISGFFKRLLPKDFDTGDLIVVMLLLLMAGDSTEDQNTALLTLALYFFM